MQLLRGFDAAARERFRGGFVSIGNFDGVHRGHQELVSTLKAKAARDRVPAVVLTFDPPPVAVLRPESVPPQLSTTTRKAELLARYGVDCVIAFPTDRNLLSLSPREFFERIVVEELDARGLVEGPNFQFGKNRAGTISDLRGFCEQFGRSLDVVEPMPYRGDALISSSLIRSLISSGDITAAVELMGHAYCITGVVGSGAARGRRIGVPTANLEQITTLLPADGVYAGFSFVDGEPHAAAINIGPNPTFGETHRKVEVHLLDVDEILYDRALAVCFLDRLRGVVAFGSETELKQQLTHDVAAARKVFAASMPLVDAERLS